MEYPKRKYKLVAKGFKINSPPEKTIKNETNKIKTIGNLCINTILFSNSKKCVFLIKLFYGLIAQETKTNIIKCHKNHK